MSTNHFDGHPIALDANGQLVDPSSDHCNPNSKSSPTLYMPIASPPTPAPSPGPSRPILHINSFNPSYSQASPYDPAHLSRLEFRSLAPLSPSIRRQYLAAILADCTPSELLFVSTTIAPLLKRDFLRELPPEIALHILSFLDEPKPLARASQVSRHWYKLLGDEWMWKRMCELFYYDWKDEVAESKSRNAREEEEEGDDDEPLEEMEPFAILPMDPALEWLTARKRAARKDHKDKSVATGSLRNTPRPLVDLGFSYRRHFKLSYSTMMNWRHGGHLLRSHRVPVVTPDSGVITSVALDADWVVVGLANCKIHVFSAKTGVLSRTLVGHESGVWAVNLVSRGGHWGGGQREAEASGSTRASPPTPGTGAGAGSWSRGSRRRRNEDGIHSMMAGMSVQDGIRGDGAGGNLDHLVTPQLRTALGLDAGYNAFSGTGAARETQKPADSKFWKSTSEGGRWERAPGEEHNHPDPGKPSDVCCATEGWGQPNALVVSGGCDKVLRVWDVKSGYCIYVLPGHTSTIRCIKVLHNRPIAVTGSRDSTLRVWDVQRGRMLRVLQGHTHSVRCLDVCGNKVVSGSYDTTCRLWDIDTGECLHVLRGHFHQIYSVAFDGVRIASGGLDTTVRVWDALTGHCLALLQGHTALVCQLQLSPTILATGGSDGRVITFSLSTFSVLHRIAAHDSSVTSLQFDKHFLVTGGNDGRVRLFETSTGNYVRELSEASESVWKVAYRKDTCAVMCKRAGKTVMEIWSFKPTDV